MKGADLGEQYGERLIHGKRFLSSRIWKPMQGSMSEPPQNTSHEHRFIFIHVPKNAGTSIKRVHNDAGTIVATKALTDDGSTYSEAEMISG